MLIIIIINLQYLLIDYHDEFLMYKIMIVIFIDLYKEVQINYLLILIVFIMFNIYFDNLFIFNIFLIIINLSIFFSIFLIILIDYLFLFIIFIIFNFLYLY